MKNWETENKPLRLLSDIAGPYEDLKTAIQGEESKFDDLAHKFMTLCNFLNPEWGDNTELFHLIKSGKLPIISTAEGDLRVDGALTEPNSFITWLKEKQK